MPVSVLTQHNDNIRSGANLQETKLNTTNVNVNDFGLLASRDVVGRIYAQPLYVPGVTIAGKVRNVVYAATMHNWVYAFDAADLSAGAGPLWKRQVDPHPVPSHFYRADYFDISNNNDDPIGILSTPVVDPAANTIYLVAAAYDPAILAGPIAQAPTAFRQLLFALDLSTGDPRPAAPGSSNPVPIAGSVPGVGYRDGKEVGDGVVVHKTANGASVDVTVHGRKMTVVDSAGGQVIFSPMQHLQRPALLLLNGLLYIAFGSHGDFDPYHGWVFAYEAASLKQRGVFCATPGGSEAGIWQAGEGPVGDSKGNVYFGSGNGDSSPAAVGGPNLGESFIRLRPGAASLDLDAYRTIIQDATNAVADEDLGAASPTILPDGFLVGGGKDGNFYLLDPAQMTKTGARASLVQTFLATRGRGSRAEVFVNGKSISTHHIHGSPVVYDSPNQGVLVYVWGENEVLRAFKYDPTAHSFPEQPNARNVVGQSTAIGAMYASNDQRNRDGMPGAILSLTADGKKLGTAILWASLPPFDNANHGSVDGILTAYDATQFDSQGRLVQLWHSHQNPNDDPGIFAKFCCPTIADGKVFLATFSNKLRIYGLRPTSDGGYSVGFGGRNALSLNGSARSAGGTLRLTGKHDLQAGSVFCTKPVNVKTFNSIFRFQTTAGNATADGLTFCIQSEGPHALGGPGGGLGYGPDPNDPNDPGFKIANSVALKFDLFDNQTIQPGSFLGLYKNGDSPTAANAIGGEIQLAALGMDLHAGHQFLVTLTYDGTNLQVTLKDLTLTTQITRLFPIDIPSISGNVAHVGFTAGTGLSSADQEILSWQFNS
jgi:outer membrane protein assembly factor BamB